MDRMLRETIARNQPLPLPSFYRIGGTPLGLHWRVIDVSRSGRSPDPEASLDREPGQGG